MLRFAILTSDPFVKKEIKHYRCSSSYSTNPISFPLINPIFLFFIFYFFFSFYLNCLHFILSLPLEIGLSFPADFGCLFYHYCFFENISKYIHVVIPPFLTQKIVICKHYLHTQSLFVLSFFGHVTWLVGS